MHHNGHSGNWAVVQFGLASVGLPVQVPVQVGLQAGLPGCTSALVRVRRESEDAMPSFLAEMRRTGSSSDDKGKSH
jgi:hypothetical protein